MAYIPLHVHSTCSPLDGMVTIEELVFRAVFLKLPAVALTDHWTTYGHHEFFKHAVKAGIKPILGAELQHSSLTGNRGLYHLTVLAENDRGYRNLVALVSRHYVKGRDVYVTPEELSELHDGLIALTGCQKGEMSQAVLHGNLGRARDVAGLLLGIFGNSNLFLEVMNHGDQREGLVFDQLKVLSKGLGVPLVVTNNDRFLRREEAEYFTLLHSLHGTAREKLEEPVAAEFYLKREKELEPYFYTVRDALERSGEIADRCSVELPAGGNIRFSDTPNPHDTLGKMSQRRFVLKFHNRNAGERSYLAGLLERELESVRTEGLAGYLLFLRELIQRSSRRGLWVEVTGGSLLESFLCYLLEIIPLNPVENGLHFESFSSMRPGVPPSLEFANSKPGKEELIELIRELLPGYELFFQVTREEMSFQRIVKEIGELLRMPDDLLGDLARIIASDRKSRTLHSMIESSDALRNLYNREELVRKTLHVADALRGRINHFNMNSSHLVLLPHPLEEVTSFVTGPGGEKYALIGNAELEAGGGWIMHVLHSHSLAALESVVGKLDGEQQRLPSLYGADDSRETEWTPETLTDRRTYALISSGDTTGVYLLESQGIRDLLLTIKPSNFNELVNVISLYRPAPIEGRLWQKYIENAEKKGKVYLPHPSLAPSLECTRGLLLYKEQVREILRSCAGLMGERAIAVENALKNRDPGELSSARLDFVRGAMERDISEEEAQKIFDFLLYNVVFTHDKALSCSQAYLSYRTAFFKAHLFDEYFVALLNNNMEVKERYQRYLDYLREIRVAVLPVHINTSGQWYENTDEGIRSPLRSVKNLEQGETQDILNERSAGGEFSSFSDFLNRMFGRISLKGVSGLIDEGAFDAEGLEREELRGMSRDFFEGGGKQGLFAIRKKVGSATQQVKRKPKSQLSLFDTGKDE